MSEPDIAPLARRLAEENNVEWRRLEGSGEGGRIVEKDVLEYLARVMSGDEAVNPTPEPLPEGMDAWPEPEAAGGNGASAAAGSSPVEDAGPAAPPASGRSGDDAVLLADDEEPPAPNAWEAGRPDDGPPADRGNGEAGEDAFLIDEVPASGPPRDASADDDFAGPKDLPDLFADDEAHADARGPAEAEADDDFFGGDFTFDHDDEPAPASRAAGPAPAAADEDQDDGYFDFGGLPGHTPGQAEAEPQGEAPASAPGSRPAAAAAPAPSAAPQRMLRRDLDVGPLTRACDVLAEELELDGPVPAAAVLVLAARKAQGELGREGEVGAVDLGGDAPRLAALPREGGVRALAEALAEPSEPRAPLALAVADLSALDLDEASLALEVPTLTLGRAHGTNGVTTAWLGVSGDVSPQRGAAFLARVDALLSAPVRLLA